MFPDEKYFLKLHHIMAHLPDFVANYGMLDRVSEESFEAVHALMAQIKAMLATMTSNQKRIETATSKAQTKLKPGVMDASVKLKQGSTGKKRGPAKNVPARLEAVTAPSDIAFFVVVVGGGSTLSFSMEKPVCRRSGKNYTFL